jgi:rare lipoprotein A
MLVSNLKSILVATILLSATTPALASGSRCSNASYYGVGDGYGYQTAANGERFNPYGLTAAHKSLPFGTIVKVTNQSNGKTVSVRINDRGPFVAGRDLDLSYGAFAAIASPSQGVARICYTL